VGEVDESHFEYTDFTDFDPGTNFSHPLGIIVSGGVHKG
jgi:hypothetical protein